MAADYGSANGFSKEFLEQSKAYAQKNRSSRVCRYPLKRIDNSSDYLMIKVLEYVPVGLGLQATQLTQDANTGDVSRVTTTTVDGKSTSKAEPLVGEALKLNISAKTAQQRFQNKKIKNLIYLPIPQSISDTTSVTWGDESLDPLSAFGLAFGAEGIKNPAAAITKFFELGVNKVTSALGDDVTKNAIAAAIAGNAFGVFGGNVSATGLISRATGQIFNPNMELLFQGVNLRSFSFVFNFVARSRAEGEEIKKIIRTFKKSAVPKNNANDDAKSGVFISAPDIFQLAYMKGNSPHPFLNKFIPAALTSVNVNYTGSNTYATYYDGTPVHVTMQLDFQELNPIYLEDYEALEKSGDTSVGY